MPPEEGGCPKATQLSPPITSQISAIIHSNVLSSCFLPVQFWAAQNRGTHMPLGRDSEEGRSKVAPGDDFEQGGKCLLTYMQRRGAGQGEGVTQLLQRGQPAWEGPPGDGCWECLGLLPLSQLQTGKAWGFSNNRTPFMVGKICWDQGFKEQPPL